MKKNLKILFWFFKLLCFSMVIYLLFFKLSDNREFAKTITMLFMGGCSFFQIRNDNQIEKIIKRSINYKLIILTITVFGLFVINNIFQVQFLKMDFGYDVSIMYYLYFIVTSTSEEILYRGYLQRKIDSINMDKNLISKGIIYSSILMVFTHLGFFYTMPLPSAISSILVVSIFSISMGVIMKETNNLLIPIIIHIFANWIHLTLANLL